MGVRTKLQDLKRFENIAAVLSKHGFGMLVDKATYGSQGLRSQPQVRLRKAFEELGGAFVKLGQLLALRPDLIPMKYCKELEKLQDQGKPVPYEDIKKVLASEFSRPMSTIFSKMNTKPLAVGSVAQVHKATLTNGDVVVVKILKPKTIETFREDIDLLTFLAARINKFVPSDVVDPQMIVKEFKKYTKKELDFSVELRNIQSFSTLDLIMQTPKAYKELSTKKVLIMEYIKGVSLSKRMYTKWPKKIRSEIAKHVAYSMMKQVFVYGLYHADPHPGNILVKEKYRLALIDFGIVGTVDPKTKITLTVLLYSLLHKDLKLLARSLTKLGIAQGSINKEELEYDLKETLSKYYDAGLDEINISELFSQSITIARKHNLSIPEKFVLLGKAIATTESVCHVLDPKFNFVRVAKPFLKKHLPKFIASKFMFSQAKEELLDYGELIVNMPKDIKKLISIKEDDHRSFSKLQGSMTRLEKEFIVLQKELIIAVLGILLIIIALVTNSGAAVVLGLSATSAILFGIGSLMMLTLMKFLYN